ncbi:hypothetical protein NHX12_000926 [Muraenolepis orangiensis]|uniref:Secreted protein n=1 Tax=Muraenolepis orangiensis TaxID=630683 RepID=A0A9Q0IG55_9TELE|nr:hypothetical protein NHX12_000926 [Muraenolepis orangiensis]
MPAPTLSLVTAALAAEAAALRSVASAMGADLSFESEEQRRERGERRKEGERRVGRRCRLKQKSQSVDIPDQTFSPAPMRASPLNRAASPVARTTAAGLAVREHNATNASQRRSPRCGELKRGYTIGKPHTSFLFWLGER